MHLENIHWTKVLFVVYVLCKLRTMLAYDILSNLGNAMTYYSMIQHHWLHYVMILHWWIFNKAISNKKLYYYLIIPSQKIRKILFCSCSALPHADEYWKDGNVPWSIFAALRTSMQPRQQAIPPCSCGCEETTLPWLAGFGRC